MTVDGDHPPDEAGMASPAATVAEAQLHHRVVELEATVAQLQQALDHRPQIEHAVGMIMVLLSCDQQRSVAVLKHISQHTNRKLIDVSDLIAASVSGGGALPSDLANAFSLVLPPRQRQR